MTATTDAAADIKIGTRLKHARLASGLKLRELADRLGCSESFLSKAENDKVRPSLAMLHKIVSALDINIPSLFSEPFADEPDPVHITRNDGRVTISTAARSHGPSIAIERLVLTERGSLLEANIHTVEPGGHTDGVYTHEGEELGFVLQGRLELRVADKVYALDAGDSFSFRSELPHGYRNPGRQPARVLWVNTPPTF